MALRIRRSLKPTEAEFTDQVLALARLRGWRSLHIRPGRTSDSWRTPVQGDGAGFPDLLLVRAPRLIVAELKIGRNRLTVDQETWLHIFGLIRSVEAYEWRPVDWPEIEKVLA